MYVIALVGLPGSGKSTVREKIMKATNLDPFVYSTDDHIEAIGKACGLTYDEVFSDAINMAKTLMNKKLSDAIAQKRNILWDQTNMSKKSRRRIFSILPKEYKVSCISILLPRSISEWKELDSRLNSREGKNIPDHVLDSMIRNYQEPSLDEGFEKIITLDIYGNPV